MKHKPKTSDTMIKLLDRYANCGDVPAGNAAHQLACQLTKKLTACETFESMVDAADHGYVPTLRGSDEHLAPAIAYDFIQTRRGRAARAHR